MQKYYSYENISRSMIDNQVDEYLYQQIKLNELHHTNYYNEPTAKLGEKNLIRYCRSSES